MKNIVKKIAKNLGYEIYRIPDSENGLPRDRIQEVCDAAGVSRIEPELTDALRSLWRPLLPRPCPVPAAFDFVAHASLDELVFNRSLSQYFHAENIGETITLTDKDSGHFYRMRMIAEVVRRYFGSGLEGNSVLDIGCSSGYYCFHTDRMGANAVLGIDARPEHEEQFTLLHGMLKARPSCQYRHVDMEYGLEQVADSHDLVMAMGVMYHVFDHPRFLKNLYRLTNKVLLLEGACSGRADEYCRPMIENPKNLRESIHGPVLYPSLKWMIEIMRWAGFKDVAYVNYPDDLGSSEEHQSLWRAMLVATK